MAFPTGWNRACSIVIQHSQVTADQTAFPVLITNDTGCLPSEMVTLGGGNAAQSDGGDIRVTSDLAGTTQLPLQVVVWTQNATPSLAKAELWVKTNISASVDTTIYVWYNAGGGQTQPSRSNSFGSDNVWDSNFVTVAHYADGTTLSMAESTSHNNTGTNHGGCTAGAGAVGTGGASLSRNSLFITHPYLSAYDAPAVTFETWVNTTLSTQLQTISRRDDGGSNRNYLLRFDTTNKITLFVIWGGFGGITSSSTYNDGNWHYVVGVFNGGSIALYIDGASIGTASVTGNQPTTNRDYWIGQFEGSSEGLTGSVDEVRYSNTNRSSTWISTCYNCMNAPSSFVVAGSPFATGGGVAPVTVSMFFSMMMRAQQ
jgi:Concanavalin A-like lectin/glucanases superfamily